ncbi:fused MFS/spermidine synthase [Jannaschia donghaensis]|uniref:Spermidine synthase n=1 Tax=Jannaschia donghaensis TaxID=420998 RepID=A0A0M6YNF4_9RHOB|nr:fused MFS/spermidine synthase [Jannaschia donghaensis]CTQ51460.1 spermidine synthase [Jannaschia donghaensis]
MRFWIIIGLITVLSAIGLTYEIAAGRVLAPFFGTSLLTWTAVIATVLAGFSLGSAIGGFIAERDRPTAVRNVQGALVAAAVLMALSPTALGLLYAMGARGTGGMLFSVFMVFFPASVLISAPSPFLAKLAVDARPGREGSSLGLVLAAGSSGAILGAILAGFVALPFFGSAMTFAACGAATLLCLPFIRSTPPGDGDGADEPADTGQKSQSGVVIGAAAFVGFAAIAGGSICEYESGLSCLHVERRGADILLYSDGITQAAERIGPNDGPSEKSSKLVLSYTQWLWDRMDRDLGPAPSVLFIGGGGYTLPTQLLHSRPQARAIAVEIDPLVTSVVRRHLPWAAAMMERTGYAAHLDDREAKGRLGIVHADGRVYLNQTEHRFDAAVMDAFSSNSVPAHLVTQETFERLRTVVDGPVYVNLIDTPDGRLARGVHAILTGLYPHVQAAQGKLSSNGRTNIVLAASSTPLAPLTDLPDGYEPAPISPSRAFTDDRGWAGHR